MSTSLYYTPVKWKLSDFSGCFVADALIAILDAFEVEHNAHSDEHSAYDFEVERESLKSFRIALISGDFTEEQDEIYHDKLGEMDYTHDEFIDVIGDILSAKSDWIRLAWF